MPTRKTESDHPLARLADEFRRAASSDLEAARADRERASAARARVQELVEDGRRREKARREAQEAYAAGTGSLEDLEAALRSEREHEDLVRCAREGAEQVAKAGSGAAARLERARCDFVERAGPLFREAVESKLDELAAELRSFAESFLAPAEQTDPALARALAQTLPGLGGVAARVESALAAAEAAAQRSGPRQFSPGEHGEELPVQERSPADVLREVAERRTDVTGRRAPVGIVAGRTMQ